MAETSYREYRRLIEHPEFVKFFRTVTPANDLQFRYGTNAPTLRLEGLTIAGV